MEIGRYGNNNRDIFKLHVQLALTHGKDFWLVSIPDPGVAQARAYPSLPISLLLGQDDCKFYFLDVLASCIIRFCQWEVLMGE